jgi:hypothetical protein
VDHILVPLQKIARLLVYFQERFSTLPQRATSLDVHYELSVHILDDGSCLSVRGDFAFIIISTFTVLRGRVNP